MQQLKTWYLLHRARRAFAPRRVFRAALRRDLLAQLPGRVWRPSFVLAPLCSLVLVLSSVTGVYAYDNPDVTPDHPLYFAKQGVEKVVEAVAVTPRLKEQAREHRVAQRISEARRLAKRERSIAPILPQLTLELEHDQDMATTTPKDEDAVEALVMIASEHPTSTARDVQKFLRREVQKMERREQEKATTTIDLLREQRLIRRQKMLQTVEAFEQRPIPSSSPVRPTRFLRPRTMQFHGQEVLDRE